MKTGYFARATEEGHKALFTQVQIVNGYNKPLCRYKPHGTLHFLWCANCVQLSYVECKKCKEEYKKLLNKLVEEIK